MDLEFTADQLALRDAARAVLADACPSSLVRAVFDGSADRSEPWTTMCTLDWPALAVPEAHGGLGLGFVEVGIVVEELARVVAPTPYLGTVTQCAAAVMAAGSSFGLAQLAAGTRTGSLAIAERGRWDPAAITTTATATADGWRLAGTKTHVLDGAHADELVVVAGEPDGLGMFVVPGPAVGGTAVQAVEPTVVDPTMPLATVVFDDVVVTGDRVLVEPGDPRAPEVVAEVLDHATAAIALSTVATCRAILEATVAYAKVREQFGRPIGSFQALKHRLADCYLAVERAAALGWVAALTVAEADPRRPLAVAMAKAAAGDCAALLTRDGLQLHGGIGFTWEHDLHFFLKRAVTGELLFGGAAYQRARVAELLGLGQEAS